MFEQIDIFGNAVPASSPKRELRLGRWHLAILQALTRGDMTDDELCLFVARNGNTVRPRRGELVEAGYVYPAGQTRSVSGRPMTRWGITEEGKLALAQPQ